MTSNAYSPVCLTLYMNNVCALSCSYCYAHPVKPQPSGVSGKHLNLVEIMAAAELVVDNCQRQGKPMTLVFHGGGEPSLDEALIDQALDEIEVLGKQRDLDIFRYIATNGIVSTRRAGWLAERFDLVGISCDGPADIQDTLRPFRIENNKNKLKSSSRYVERTARILREAGKAFHVRVTVTPTSFHRQPEVARYICETLRPQEIHVEPVYSHRQTGDPGIAEETDGFKQAQAEAYVEAFLEARRVARSYGIPWLSSGTRPQEIHGRYCHVFRDVLNLVPGGAVTACFKVGNSDELADSPLKIGQVDEQAGRVTLDEERIIWLQQELERIPEECVDCVNRLHCTHFCPNFCPVVDTRPGGRLPQAALFHCRVQFLLAGGFS